MEGNESNQEVTGLCKAGCGFYGSSANSGYCSLCYKNKLRKSLQLQDVASASSPSSVTSTHYCSSSVDRVEQRLTSEENELKTPDVRPLTPPSPPSPPSKPTDPNSILENNVEKMTDTVPKLNLDSDLEPQPTNIKNGELPGSISSLAPPLAPTSSSSSSPSTATTQPPNQILESEEPKNLKKKNRCWICNKKVGLTGFGCRCNGLYCGSHRYSDQHNCSFDYKQQAQEEIKKNNPKIIFEKVKKI